MRKAIFHEETRPSAWRARASACVATTNGTHECGRSRAVGRMKKTRTFICGSAWSARESMRVRADCIDETKIGGTPAADLASPSKLLLVEVARSQRCARFDKH